MHFSEFLDGVWSSISSMIDLLKDSRIGSYMFGGVSLWIVLITFFVAWLLIRFYVNSYGGGRINKGD